MVKCKRKEQLYNIICSYSYGRQTLNVGSIKYEIRYEAVLAL